MGLDIFFTKCKREGVGYFRKVNFLVKYFMNLGFDVDNQTPLALHREDIIELKNRCKMVLEDPSMASELLPTMDDSSLEALSTTNVIWMMFKKF